MMKAELIVGECHYYVALDRIKAFPDSYFAVALSPQWQQNGSDRNNSFVHQLRIDGCKHSELFEHIVQYVQHGCVARNREGDCLIDRSLLPSLREDADYFCLSGMVSEIDALMTSDTPLYNKLRDTYNNAREITCGCRRLGFELEKGYHGSMEKVYIDLHNCLKKTFQGVPFAFCCQHNNENFLSIEEHNLKPAYSPIISMISLKDIMKDNSSEELTKLKLRPNHYLIKSIEFTMNRAFGDFGNNNQHFALQYQRLVVNTATQMSEKVIVSSNEATSADSTSGCVIVMVACGQHQIEAVVSQPNSTDDVFNCICTAPYQSDSYQPSCCYIGMREDCTCEFKPITEGVQLLFVYDIVMDTKYFSSFNTISLLGLSKPYIKLLSLELEKDCNLVQNIFFHQTYMKEGLREEALTGFDAMLYNALKATGVPISLVYVMRNVTCLNERYDEEVEDSVNLLSDSFDTRLDVHKLKGNDCDVPFVGIGKGDCWFDCNHEVNAFSLEIDNTICAAMIVGVGESQY